VSKALAVLNAGSSSIKFAIYSVGETLRFKGQLEKIGVAPHLYVTDDKGKRIVERSWPAEGFDHRVGTRELLEAAISLLNGAEVAAVGHRVVHGGTRFAAPIRIDADVLASLARLAPLAPLHQPHNLAPIEAIAQAAPHVPQVACFDTAFHRKQPALAQQFAIPRELTEAGVQRYGFHGLSYEYVSSQLGYLDPRLASGRVIIAHLGNGASLCAVHDRRSVASTMGFTAVDGLMMGTRCGAIDPGVLIYLMDNRGMDARAIEDLVYRKSGLLGVSGISSDMRTLQASTEPAAAEAIDLFVYRVIREIGSLCAALGGLDALVFTGGIGENDAVVRARVIKGCAWLGLVLDEARNAAGKGRISAGGSAVSAWVVRTDEERMMARHTAAVLGLASVEVNAV
jgi:acetate kinase